MGQQCLLFRSDCSEMLHGEWDGCRPIETRHVRKNAHIDIVCKHWQLSGVLSTLHTVFCDCHFVPLQFNHYETECCRGAQLSGKDDGRIC